MTVCGNNFLSVISVALMHFVTDVGIRWLDNMKHFCNKKKRQPVSLMSFVNIQVAARLTWTFELQLIENNTCIIRLCFKGKINV